VSFKVTNIAGFTKGLRDKIERAAKDVEYARKRATQTYVEALMENIPVWSGRTIRSIRVGNSASFAQVEGAPTPQQAARFGPTSLQSLGEEAMRRGAEATALAQVAGASYDINKELHITVSSEAWGLVEAGAAPDTERARNDAVVSEIARQRAMAAHGFLKG
jgi:hypothetical protein